MARVTAPRTVQPRHTAPPEETFDSALRGYDRRQVDTRLKALQEQLDAKDAARRRAAEEAVSEGKRARIAEEQLRDALAKLKDARVNGTTSGPGSGPAKSTADEHDGFGYRAERILRAAENEAAATRSSASQEAAAIVEQARAQAEQHRHDLEQQLIQRAGLLDQQAAERTAAIVEREEAAAAVLHAARQDADEIHGAALRSAERLQHETEAKAREVRAQAEQYAQQQRDAANRELSRVAALHGGVRAELGRLHKLLDAELSTAVEQGSGPPTQTPDG